MESADFRSYAHTDDHEMSRNDPDHNTCKSLILSTPPNPPWKNRNISGLNENASAVGGERSTAEAGEKSKLNGRVGLQISCQW
jgi:hypothetical protein